MNHKTISIKNFESYIVDYFDGRLSKEEQHALFAFLETHPSLAADFELFKQSEDAVVTPDGVIFPEPDKLKKNVIFSVNDIHEFNYHNYFIAFYEDDLDRSVRQTLSAFLEKNSFLLPEFENFGKLRLVPDENLIFNDKQQLKHTLFRRPSVIWIAVASVAAVLLLFFLFNPIVNTPSPVTPDPPFVQTDENPSEISSDTIFYMPIPSPHPPKELNPKPTPILPIVHTEKIVPSSNDPEETEPLPEILPSEQHTEIVAVAPNETIRILEPDIVVIRTIPESTPAADTLLAAYQEQQQGKGRFLKILSWGVKQYNYISKDDITVMKVENLTTNETTYYLCRGE